MIYKEIFPLIKIKALVACTTLPIILSFPAVANFPKSGRVKLFAGRTSLKNTKKSSTHVVRHFDGRSLMMKIPLLVMSMAAAMLAGLSLIFFVL